jgi:hypothetical protein
VPGSVCSRRVGTLLARQLCSSCCWVGVGRGPANGGRHWPTRVACQGCGFIHHPQSLYYTPGCFPETSGDPLSSLWSDWLYCPIRVYTVLYRILLLAVKVCEGRNPTVVALWLYECYAVHASRFAQPAPNAALGGLRGAEVASTLYEALSHLLATDTFFLPRATASRGIKLRGARNA